MSAIEERNRISEVKLDVTIDKPVRRPVYYGDRRRQATVATKVSTLDPAL